ncbi:MAG: FAD-dependent oxidoreductase [Beijerinckiaceae bacterium]
MPEVPSVLIRADGTGSFDARVAVIIVGAGAAGLVAALKAKEDGAEVLVLERDALPMGSTALSAGLIPAAETRFQKLAGVKDSHALFARDIMAKADNEPDLAAVDVVTSAIGPVLEWLADRHDMPFTVITNFTYPGHSANRMHGLPSRSGAELMDRLRNACEVAGIDLMTNTVVRQLFADNTGRVTGVRLLRPDGSQEDIGCDCLVLACNGYGGNPELVAQYIPEMDGALYFGHSGNKGDAIVWGQALGARLHHLSGYQGHGSVANPHGILITWATIVEGGFQVNCHSARFANEAHGYSEAAASVIQQPNGQAWSIFDARIAGIARQFDDFKNAEAQGAIKSADTVAALAQLLGQSSAALERTFAEVCLLKKEGQRDSFGRNWKDVPQLNAPFFAVRVTGALFHTQGGLVVNSDARVLKEEGGLLPNLLAAGGAACGVSGSGASGYLSGNGLLTAVAYGFIAGREAARMAQGNASQ